MKRYVFFYFIVDASYGMKGKKIGAINNAIQSLLSDIIDVTEDNMEIYVRILAYSDETHWMDEAPTRVEDYCWKDIEASGNPSTHDMFTTLISEFGRFEICNKNALLIPVLFSGTTCNDNYDKMLKNLSSVPSFKEGIKIGVTIGENANEDLLNLFTGNRELIFCVEHLYWLKKAIKKDDHGAIYDDDWDVDNSLDMIHKKGN